MKRCSIMFFLIVFFICGCASNNNAETKNETETIVLNEKSKNESETISETVPIEKQDELNDFSENVEIILEATLMNGENIYDYLENLGKNNPGLNLSVYDDAHYIKTITEKERLDYINSIENENGMNKIVDSIKKDEICKDVIVEIKSNESFDSFEIYVEPEKYKQKQIYCSFYFSVILKSVSDEYQACKYIEPENRCFEIKIFDNNTKEEIK